MLQLKSVTNLKTLLKVRRLYLDAFPGFERLPFWVLLYKAKKSDSKLSAIYNGDQFVGLTNVAYYQDIVYLFYLAIDPTLRSHGYGSKILHLLKENYPDKRIFLNIEKIDEMSDNFAQRVKRKNSISRTASKMPILKSKQTRSPMKFYTPGDPLPDRIMTYCLSLTYIPSLENSFYKIKQEPEILQFPSSCLFCTFSHHQLCIKLDTFNFLIR
ncbi:GNAT family N-acetyltransferase [Jeotgalibaca porci]|uniref:GNAT family N-acetyltransferase n=1 Tax=Jeotgalibaca porci TaxID=1868793 RepID=A0A6G7WFV4_9LACT|nr:GNAT family N-acetyltransferase [Jeotgalibaca porci]QIK51175.1 GNAT family N-acetyltransferase [Jeotgalibaca porci]